MWRAHKALRRRHRALKLREGRACSHVCAAGGGSAGGFIRVAISFLEPDQVRNGELEGGARDGVKAPSGKQG